MRHSWCVAYGREQKGEGAGTNLLLFFQAWYSCPATYCFNHSEVDGENQFVEMGMYAGAGAVASAEVARLDRGLGSKCDGAGDKLFFQNEADLEGV